MCRLRILEMALHVTKDRTEIQEGKKPYNQGSADVAFVHL
jgi:hypothetical protein